MKSVKSKIRAPDSFLLGVPLTESCLDFVISIKWYTFGLKYWYTFQLKKTVWTKISFLQKAAKKITG
jgi:hypothetical protein